LAGCEITINSSPEIIYPGASATLTNQNACVIPSDPSQSPGEIEIIVIDLKSPDPLAGETVALDDDGWWSIDITAPAIPGQYHLFWNCLEVEDPYWGLLQIAQFPLDLTLSDTKISEPTEITASATWCQNETDQGIDDLIGENPVMEFLVNDEVVGTITADDPHPQGTAEIALNFDDPGDYDVTARCSYDQVIFDYASYDNVGIDVNEWIEKTSAYRMENTDTGHLLFIVEEPEPTTTPTATLPSKPEKPARGVVVDPKFAG